MKDTDQMLIGTVWTRGKGSHSPVTGTIDSINDHGPRLRLSDGSKRRLHWGELDFGWEPIDRKSEDRYVLWKLANKAEFLEAKERELMGIENGSAPVMTEPEIGTKECHGPWHRHGPTKDAPATYDLVPINQFSINTKGMNAGKLASLCNSCREKQRASNDTRQAAKATLNKKRPVHAPAPLNPVVQEIPEPVMIEPVTVTETGVVYRWRVTVVQPTEHLVQAKDFLDAAAQVAALGEVTKVEKL